MATSFFDCKHTLNTSVDIFPRLSNRGVLPSYKTIAANTVAKQATNCTLIRKWSGKKTAHATDVAMFDRAWVYSLTILSSFLMMTATENPLRALRRMQVVINAYTTVTSVPANRVGSGLEPLPKRHLHTGTHIHAGTHSLFLSVSLSVC